MKKKKLYLILTNGVNLKELHISYEEFYINQKLYNNYSGKIIWKDDNTTDYYLEGQSHRIDGRAIQYTAEKNDGCFALRGETIYFAEEWFEKLTDEEKLQALFNIDEWK